MTNPNDPANPIQSKTLASLPDANCSGLTKREYFAAMAMQGFRADPVLSQSLVDSVRDGAFPGSIGKDDDEFIARCSVAQADALIAALNKEAK